MRKPFFICTGFCFQTQLDRSEREKKTEIFSYVAASKIKVQQFLLPQVKDKDFFNQYKTRNEILIKREKERIIIKKTRINGKTT